MNWLTKAFKKVFSEEIEDKEEYLIENEHHTYKQSKTPFRFPLISDEEKERPSESDLTDVEPEYEPMPLYMHKQWQQDRQSTIVHQATKTRHEPIPKQTEKDTYQEVKPRITKVPVQSKTFTPTDVPSPIHGFNRPKISPIDELLAKKNTDETVEEIVATVITPPPVIPSQNERIIFEKPRVIEQQSVNEQQVMEKEPEKLDVVNTLESAKLEPSIEEPDAAADNPVIDLQPTEKKKKSLPFNVMMLNSDKQKYQQKTLQTVPTTSVSHQGPVGTEEKQSSLQVREEAPISQQVSVAPSQEISLSDRQSVSQEVINEVQVHEVPSKQPAEELHSGYTFPKERYLVPPEQKTQDYEWMQMQADRLIEALSYFQVKAEIIQMVQGPAVTQFEMTVGQGTKVSKIRNLADDLKLALAAKDIRIQAPIPGKSSIGIEIPNRTSRPVRLSEVVGSKDFTDSDSPLEAALGLDLTGKPVTLDLRKMPHGLIAGATGSGKSVCINSLLISLLYKATPQELNLLLIDPKMVELAPFNHIPHLVSPVITDVKAATAALKWAVEEMERRYQLFAHTGVRDITRYNAMAEEKRQFAQKMPYLLIVIDELADLMMMAPTEVEESICRIAQKARACGIHLVVATQRPSVDVITGLIKANIPTRIAFSVSSQIDSRTILDVQGAERLLGRGDMLYLGNGMSAPIRLQGTYVTDEEMEEIIEHARSQGEPSYLFEQEELVRKLEVAEDQDELFEEACRFILEQGSASTSLLQRKFHIGYNRAARLVDLMEQHGYVSESRGSRAREVFITESDLQLLFND